MRQTGDLRSVVRLYRREANIDTGKWTMDSCGGAMQRSTILATKHWQQAALNIPPGCSASSCERRCNAAFCRVCVWCMMAGHMR